MATENLVTSFNIPDGEPQACVLEMDNSLFLPSFTDHKLQQKHYIYLVARVITDYIPCLQFLKTSIPKHIPHPYSNEMAKQTDTVSIISIMDA